MKVHRPLLQCLALHHSSIKEYLLVKQDAAKSVMLLTP